MLLLLSSLLLSTYMSTINPKVSAYIPQHIYDPFKLFCKKRGLSMSQGVALIFSEYFALDLSEVPKNSTSGLLIERIEALEQEFADFKKSFQDRPQLTNAQHKLENVVVRDSSSLGDSPLEDAETTLVDDLGF